MANKLTKLLQVAFCTNFQLYFQSHVAHVNTVGRNFYSDHKLLQKIYEDAQEQIDTYAEFLRTLEATMPPTLADIIDGSEISDSGDAMSDLGYLQRIYNITETTIDLLTELYPIAESARQFGLSGFIQERLITHRRFCWMLRSILEAK